MGISLGAAMLGGAALSFLGGERANSARAAATESANRTSIELANTGYTRAMKDMRSAGLNPILAGRYGPAATPNIQVPQIENTISPAVSTALQGYKMKADVAKIESEIEQISYQHDLTEAQTYNVRALTQRVMEETDKMSMQNAVNLVISEWKVKNPNATLAKEFGGDLKTVRGMLTQAAAAAMDYKGR